MFVLSRFYEPRRAFAAAFEACPGEGGGYVGV